MTPHKQAADYAAIAVAPVLIFLMISSLATFLMLILYSGGFSQRVSWTLLCFTMGAVAVARLAIERDRSYSLGYAAALGLVTFIVMLRFVDSPIFCAFILVVICYLADVIVRDCTLIDDSVDSSGQGLIDSGTLFVRKQIEASSTSDDALGKQTQSRPPQQKRRRKAAHQPGRTVMYFAMGALPLFGLGQFFLRNDADTWARAQSMLAIYLFASLSLLVTTSFLGLRRYLRQRDTEMPADVTVAWLAGGLALIAAVLIIAYLAPLPGKAIASIGVPEFLDSPAGNLASRFGWGSEGAEQSDPDASTTMDDPNQSDKEVHSMAAREGAAPGDVGDGNRQDGPAGKQSGGKKKSGGAGDQQESGPSQSKSDGDQQQSGKNGQPSGGQQQDSESSSQSSENSQQTDSSQQTGTQRDGETGEQAKQSQDDSGSSDSEGRDSEGRDSENQETSGENDENDENQRSRGGEQSEGTDLTSPDDGESSDGESSNSSRSGASDAASRGGQTLGSTFSMIATLIKFLIFLALCIVVGTFAWLHRHAFVQWWNQLFGSESEPIEASVEPLLRSTPDLPARPFSSFRNPIGKESDRRRVVVITFQAFDAWAREHGIPRGQDETPAEFLRRFRKTMPQMSAPVSTLVDAYNRIVYGRGAATKHDAAAAEQVWHAMRSQL